MNQQRSKRLSEARKEQLRLLFKPYSGIPNDGNAMMLPWEFLLLGHYPEYQTQQNLLLFEEKQLQQQRYVVKTFRDQGRICPKVSEEEIEVVAWLLPCTEPEDTEKLLELFGLNTKLRRGYEQVSWACNYFWITAKRFGPKDDAEWAYSEAIMENNTLLKRYEKEIEQERRSAESSQHRVDTLIRAMNPLVFIAEKNSQELGEYAGTILKMFGGDKNLLLVYFQNHAGKSQREIAKSLGVSPATVNGMIKEIENKMGVRMVRHKGGAGSHVGDLYKKNRTRMNRTDHSID